MDFVNNYKDVEVNKSIDADAPIDADDDFPIETTIDNVDTVDTVNFNDDDGGIIYNLLHMIDDIYVYGRTIIENNYFNLSINDDFNLVYPNIYIGNYSTSTNFNLLKNIGITHIISVIPSFNPPFIDKFKYHHIEAYDDDIQNMTQYFENSNKFISDCLNEGGKVLIHCMVGRSRSVTIFLAFLIHIIHGNFHRNNLNLETCNDIYNSIEYNKFIKDKRISNTYDGINNKNTSNYNNYDYNSNFEFQNINKLEHIHPQFSNKEKNFILYKKEKMLQEVDELINTYSILKKEHHIKTNLNTSNDLTDLTDLSYKNINDLNNIVKKMKIQSGDHFILQLLKYVKTYRNIACPNINFTNQLSNYIFL